MRYLYEHDAAPAVDAPTLTAPDHARLAHLPKEWLATMRQALAAGDLQGAMGGVAMIEAEHAELAAQLRALLAAYRLDDLDNLLAAAAATAP